MKIVTKNIYLAIALAIILGISSCQEKKGDEYFVQLAVKDLDKLIKPINDFQEKEKRLPVKLDELIDKKYIKALPILPRDIYFGEQNGYSYEPLSGLNFQVYELKSMAVMGLSADLNIYYSPISNEKHGRAPTNDWEWSNRYKVKKRLNENWIYCY